MSTIRGADGIYVMDCGRVVQDGSFDALFETPGRFRELMPRQMALIDRRRAGPLRALVLRTTRSA